MARRVAIAFVVTITLAGCTCRTCNLDPHQIWGQKGYTGQTGLFYQDENGVLRDGDGAEVIEYGGKGCRAF